MSTEDGDLAYEFIGFCHVCFLLSNFKR
jgi:hypothetical protein